MNHVILRLSAKNGLISHSLLKNIVRATSSISNESQAKDVNFQRVFHYPHVIKLAFYQRFKVYMTGSTCLLTSVGIANGFEALPGTISTISGLLSFTTIGLLISGEWMRRVIGIIYIDETDLKTVKISHIGFWGKRKDILVNIEDIKFFSDTPQTGTPSKNVFWKVGFYDSKLSTMFISTRYGGIEDPEKFKLIFGGTVLE